MVIKGSSVGKRLRENDSDIDEDDGAPPPPHTQSYHGSSSELQCYYPRPAWSLAPWQSIAISVASQSQEDILHARSIKTNNTFILRDLSKFHTEQKHYSRRREQEQKNSSDRAGKALFNGMKRHWDSAAKLHQQLLRVDFEATKRNKDARRQEDLLKETESLTKKLLENMLLDRQRAPVTSGSSSKRSVKEKQGSGGTKRDSAGGPIAAPPPQEGSISASSASSSSSAVLDSAVLLLQAASENEEPFEGQLKLLNTLNGARPLRDYQRSALRWMLHLYNQGLNGILADEMGLGKTVQTLALIAYFAEHKNDWGPHLIVVPTTVVLNWAAECRRWCPGFKIITYIGSPKERAALRQGWTSEDAFHICITTYNLVINDRSVFRRRPWGLLVLDEAHHIKNFASLKWRSLFDLQAQHRLMLTGTPLQNSVMELWSLFHFLLPFASAFQSEDEFRDWYSNPMSEMVEGRSDLNEDVVRRLQALLRPFLLRRLKRDVESQLPTKTEKVILCRLSRRQRALYDEFIQNAETRRRLQSGGNGGLFGVLLQLRKVCNHPDLFAERPTRSPFVMSMPLGTHRGAVISVPTLALCVGESGVRRNNCWNRADFSLEIVDLNVPSRDEEGLSCVADVALTSWLQAVVWDTWVVLLGTAAVSELLLFNERVDEHSAPQQRLAPMAISESVFRRSIMPNGRRSNCYPPLSDMFSVAGGVLLDALHARRDLRHSISQRQHRVLSIRASVSKQLFQYVPLWTRTGGNSGRHRKSFSLVVPLRSAQCAQLFPSLVPSVAERFGHWTTQQLIERVCVYVPAVVSRGGLRLVPTRRHPEVCLCNSSLLPTCAPDIDRFAPLSVEQLTPIFAKHLDHLRWHHPQHPFTNHCAAAALRPLDPCPPPDFATFRPTRFFAEEGWAADARRCMGFPDKRLLIHDCGKFQVLEPLLKKLRAEGHRALIFTQFTLMLDLLEKFLASIGVSYLRIDGATKPESRQRFVDTFNETEGIACMILSTRSGGIGLNLTGADTVIFYDSDWNPTIDLQAQDRCHRIGQTRPVTIFRLITQFTVEEKILEKARERKMLNNVVIRGGQFASIANVGSAEGDVPSAEDVYASIFSTTSSLRSFFHDLDEDADFQVTPPSSNGDIARDMTAAEDPEDQEALRAMNEEIEEQREATACAEQEMGGDVLPNTPIDPSSCGLSSEPFSTPSIGLAGVQAGVVFSSVLAKSAICPNTSVVDGDTAAQRAAKVQILRNFRLTNSSSTGGGDSMSASSLSAASAAVRHMAVVYDSTHPQHAQRQLLLLSNHYGLEVRAAT